MTCMFFIALYPCLKPTFLWSTSRSWSLSGSIGGT
jgi:hypothetical protein